MANILIDSNTFQKLYGYHKNKTDSDQVVDVKKLYSELLSNNKHKICIPVHCIYEIFTKPFYKSQFKNLFSFLKTSKIEILTINNGEIEVIKYSSHGILELDESATYEALFLSKINYEVKEIREYLNYLIFVIKYVIIDFLRVELFKFELVDKNLDKVILELFEVHRNRLDSIISVYLTDEISRGYKEGNAKSRTKNFIIQFCGKLFSEVYEQLKDANVELKKIINSEQQILSKTSNTLEYLKNKIQQIEKVHKIDYLQVIENKYFTELISLNYPIDFIKYLILILNKIIRRAKFDKNDTIDSSLFLYSKEMLILTFDNSICGYLEKWHKENYHFIQTFKKL